MSTPEELAAARRASLTGSLMDLFLSHGQRHTSLVAWTFEMGMSFLSQVALAPDQSPLRQLPDFDRYSKAATAAVEAGRKSLGHVIVVSTPRVTLR